MTDYPKYLEAELHPDIRIEIAILFFNARVKQKLSIENVSKKTNLSVQDIGELETSAQCYDFEKIIKLLDFYQKKLPLSPICFHNLPDDIAKKYFEG